MKKILLVEDEKILAQMYKDKLEEGGHEVDWVLSVQDALEFLKTKKYNLVLLDIILPKENGIGLLKRLKELKETVKVPIVAFSNFDDPSVKKKALELGVKDYLIKTQYTPKDLLREIENFF